MEVHLRKIAESDTANIVKWRNSDDVRRWLYSQKELTSEEHLGWLKNVVGKGLCVQYIIVVDDNNSTVDIGTTFIKRSSANSKDGEFGIFIGESAARGKHCALPATIKMLHIGFDRLKLEQIYLTVFSENIPAVKTYLKAGFHITDEYEYSKDDIRKVLRMEIARSQLLCGG